MEKELLADYEKIRTLKEEIVRNVAELSSAIPEAKELVEAMKGSIGESQSETMRRMKEALSWISDHLEDGERHFADFSGHMSRVSSWIDSMGKLCELMKLVSDH